MGWGLKFLLGYNILGITRGQYIGFNAFVINLEGPDLAPNKNNWILQMGFQTIGVLGGQRGVLSRQTGFLDDTTGTLGVYWFM